MSKLYGVTLKQFGEMVESMRKVYPFKDENTIIIDTKDQLWNAHLKLNIATHDVENDVHITLSKGLCGEEVEDI